METLNKTPINPSRPFGLQPTDRAAFILAHPDDELIIGGALWHLSSNKLPLDVIVLSDGEASTKGRPEFVKSGRRREESISALEVYEVPVENQHYLAMPDGRLHLTEINQAASTGLTRLLGELGTKVVITTGDNGYDRHLDHIASHQIAVKAATTLGNVAVWHQTSRPALENFEVDSYIKLCALSRHYSQFTLHKSEPFQGYNFVRYKDFDIHADTFRELIPYLSLFDNEAYNPVNLSNSQSLIYTDSQKIGVNNEALQYTH